LVKDEVLVQHLQADYHAADLAPADRAMLDYASKLTRTPADVTQSDVDLLRNAGFDAAAILDICQVTAYYGFVNRLADGLGVELEEFWDD
jgi:uncharacterized peroxidase-related enzyme